jgi:NAD(P)-dependent dehydrogenase (short-subunit alcohol dehydrogenase family)
MKGTAETDHDNGGSCNTSFPPHRLIDSSAIVKDVQQLLESVEEWVPSPALCSNIYADSIQRGLYDLQRGYAHPYFSRSDGPHSLIRTLYHAAVNVAGPYFMTTAFAPMLMKSDNGNVINIASIAPLHLQRSVP